MARTKKVGITGRFGARYGRKAKRSVKIIEENMKKNHVCPKCDRPYVKREAAGIWKCRKCGAVFTGGAYVPQTPMAKSCPRCGAEVDHKSYMENKCPKCRYRILFKNVPETTRIIKAR